MRRLLLIAATTVGCVCVDPAELTTFACEEDGGGCPDELRCCAGLCARSCGGAGGGRAGGTSAGGTANGGGVAGGGLAISGGTAGGASAGGTSGGDAGGSAGGGAAGGQAGGEAQGGGSSGGVPSAGGVAGGAGAGVSNGRLCTAGVTPCASGHCAQGRCCERACGSPCESCALAGREGQCQLLPEGSVASCSPFACDGQATCPRSCTSAQQCAAGHFCDSAGQCQPTRASGQSCTTNGQCTSSFCANGVCCASACTGSCDRCDLPGSLGVCRAVTAGTPGEPSCGGAVVCDGANVDCPITCASGCPSGTYCAGTLCAAQKPLGAACGATNECSSGFCVDGVCCDAACGNGASDCQACNRAGSVGTCALAGATTECRASTGVCDAPERCTGTSATCPSDDLAARDGQDCGSTTSWSGTCAPAGGNCPTTGTEAGQTIVRTCASNACTSAMMGTSRACSFNPSGSDCGTATTWSGTCSQSGSGCATAGTEAGSTTPRTCAASGQCVAGSSVGTSRGCTFNPMGIACGSSTAWSGICTQTGATCSTTGTETGTITPNGCNSSGACVAMGPPMLTSRACTFDPSMIVCGTSTAWSGTCTPPGGQPCSPSGTESGTITVSACNAAGACVAGAGQATSRACSRNPEGATCGAGFCSDCTGSGDACGLIQERVCTSTGLCMSRYLSPPEICQCPGGSICPL